MDNVHASPKINSRNDVDMIWSAVESGCSGVVWGQNLVGCLGVMGLQPPLVRCARGAIGGIDASVVHVYSVHRIGVVLLE